MLEPAIVHSAKLTSLFQKEIYTEDFYYYMGYPYCAGIPTFEVRDNSFQWAIIDNDKVVGYFAYYIEPWLDSVDSFGLYSFDKGNQIIGIDVFRKMEELVARHHRVAWRVIDGNPVIRHYDRFCEKHHGYKTVLHDSTKDLSGKFRNEFRYEIISNH